VNNTAFNLQTGFRVVGTFNASLTGNTAFNNTDYGFFIMGRNRTFMSGNIVYNNRLDMSISAVTAFSLNITNMSFLNPLGTYDNYTILGLLRFSQRF
jgi:parallel beta-helix repeat protein